MTDFEEVDEVVFAEESFENRVMQSKMYLLGPQYESKGSAKPRLSFSFGSSRGGISLICELGISFPKSYPS